MILWIIFSESGPAETGSIQKGITRRRKKKQILPCRKDLFLLDQDAYFTRRDSFAFSSASTMAGINTAWMSAPGAVEVK